MTNIIDTSALGIEVSWSFGDGDADAVRLDRARVRDIFSAHGFASCAPNQEPDLDGVLKAIRRKATTVSGVAVKEIARPNKDTPRALGIYVRRAVDGEAGDTWEMICRVRAEGTQVTCIAPEGATTSPSDALAFKAWHEGARLTTMGNQLLAEVHNGELSASLVDAATICRKIDRRPGGGGVYMLFKGDKAEAFAQLLLDLQRETASRSYAHQFRAQIQEVYQKPLTVASWKASASTAITQQIQTLVTDLDNMLDLKMRPSTMEKRAHEADLLDQLTEQARVFLEGEADALQAMIRKVKSAFLTATTQNLSEAEQVLKSFGMPERARPQAPAPVPVVAAPPVPTPSRGRRPISISDLLDV